MTDKINPEISHHFVMCGGEPSHWSVCILPNINNRESAEQVEKQILSDRAIVEDMKKILELWRLGHIQDESAYTRFKSILDTGVTQRHLSNVRGK